MLIVITSIKSNKEFLDGPFALPIAPTLEPYRNVWEGLNFGVLMQQQPALCDDRIGAGCGSGPGSGLRAQPVRNSGQEDTSLRCC